MKNLLVLGDSHAKCFTYIQKHNVFSDINIIIKGVGGATARGISNPNSSSKALSIWTELLDKTNEKFDWITIGLGEVDCNFMIWWNVENKNKIISKELNKSIIPYCNFIKYLSKKTKNKIIIRGATLPTVVKYTDSSLPDHNLRKQIKATYKDRTDLTIRFNKRIKKFAENSGNIYIDTIEETINQDGLLKDIYRKPNDHHLPMDVAAIYWGLKIDRIIRGNQ